MVEHEEATAMFFEPVKFQTLEKCTVRMGPEKTDPKVGEFPRGVVIDVVLQTKNSIGIEVFQTISAPVRGYAKTDRSLI